MRLKITFFIESLLAVLKRTHKVTVTIVLLQVHLQALLT